MPTFYASPLTSDRIPLDDTMPVPAITDGRLDTAHTFTIGSDAITLDTSDADAAAQTVGAVYIYTDENVVSPVALSETGGTVTPDTITVFTAFRKLGKDFRLWQTALTGRAETVLTHFTRETSATEANIYQIAIVGEPFLDIPNDNTFQRIDLSNTRRNNVIHTSIYGKDTVVPNVNPNTKRRVAYRSRFQEKQLALDLIGILEQYDHFYIVEDIVNFPSRVYEAYMPDADIRYNYSTTWRASGFDLQIVIAER